MIVFFSNQISVLIHLMFFCVLVGGLANAGPGSPKLADAVKAVGGTISFASDGSGMPVSIDLYNGNNPLKGRGGKNDAVNDAWLEKLAGLTSLKNLSLSNCAVTDEGMRLVGQLTRLEELNLTLTAVSDEGLKHLGNLTELRVLGLASSQCTGTGFANFDKLKKLESVNFHFTPVNDAGLEAISKIPVNGRFWFAHTKFTNEGAKALSRMKGLKVCGIGSASPESSGDAVAPLTGLPIEDLSLLDNQADPAGIAHAATIGSLVRLDIAYAPKADDESLELLAQHPKLRELRIGGSPSVTNAGILALKDAASLEKLSLQRLKNVSAEGVAALKAARPDLEIEFK